MDENFWRIKHIQMKGLLGLHDLCWELHKKVNILGGSNGSGKTTLLHAIAMLLQGAPIDESKTEEVKIHCEALFDSLSAELYSGAYIEIERAVKSTKEDVEDSEIGDSHSKRKKVIETISIKRSSKIPQEVGVDQFAKHIIYINSADQAISSISKLMESSSKIGRPAITTLDLLLEQALNVRNQLFAQRMSKALQEENEDELLNLRNLFGRFEKAVRSFMPQYSILDTSTLLFSPTGNKDIEIKYFRLSTGEKQLLYLLLTVCNTLGESTILLLDEADMGMHIDWKKILIRELVNLNPNMQIIAATHSPSLIEGWYENVKEISQLYC